jgi:hypothetical protein
MIATDAEIPLDKNKPVVLLPLQLRPKILDHSAEAKQMRMRLGPRKFLIESDSQLQTNIVKCLYSGLARRLQHQHAAPLRELSIRPVMTSALDSAGIPRREADAVGICTEAGTLQMREPSYPKFCSLCLKVKSVTSHSF